MLITHPSVLHFMGLKLLNYTKRKKKSKQRFEVTFENQIQDVCLTRKAMYSPSTCPIPCSLKIRMSAWLIKSNKLRPPALRGHVSNASFKQ